MLIGQRIKTLRTQQNISIDELASKLGKNRTTIYRYENGDIENLPLGILDSLANTLNTTPAYLLGWKDNKDDAIDDETGLKMKHIEMWRKEFEGYILTEEESRKIIEYIKFLLSTRQK